MCTNSTSNILKSLTQTLIIWSVQCTCGTRQRKRCQTVPFYLQYCTVSIPRYNMDNGMPENRKERKAMQ